MSEDMIQKILVFSSVILFTGLIVLYRLKNKELRREAAVRSWERRSMRCVTISMTREHSWPQCRNASTLQNVCSPPGVSRKRTRVGDCSHWR